MNFEAQVLRSSETRPRGSSNHEDKKHTNRTSMLNLNNNNRIDSVEETTGKLFDKKLTKSILNKRIDTLRDLSRAQVCLLEEYRNRSSSISDEDNQKFIKECSKIMDRFKLQKGEICRELNSPVVCEVKIKHH
jgi:hypothetical protein